MVVKGKPSDTEKAPGEETTGSATSPKAVSIEIPESLTVRQLANLLRVSPVDIIKQLMRQGIMANINQTVDYQSAAAVASSLGYEAHPQAQTVKKHVSVISEIKKHQLQETETGLKLRPPVVTIMGHVDHGKTRLLDAIRQTNVMATEAGAITQHIGAYQVEIKGQKITFLDTPGHEAFTAMRARGAQVTDITVLVVAADDGVMPQTLEAINHAKAAGVPIVVAINKIDKPGANPDRVKQQLADAGLVIEEWGGDTVCVPVSAKEKTGIAELLENIMVVAEVENLRANPSQPAVGVVIEAKLDKTRGPLATVLVHNGTLRLGDTIVVGSTWGRVKAMFNDAGKQMKKAEPATPVEILGLVNVPQVGDTLSVVSGEHQARAIIQASQQQTSAPKSIRLTELYEQIKTGAVKELNVILKTDVEGSIEPIRSSLERLGTEDIKVRVIHAASGNITRSDVMLAIASKGLIVSFNTKTESGAQRLAEIEGIDIRYYDVIYSLADDVAKALKGMLEPTYVEVIEGRAEVREVFPAAKKLKAAGAYVTQGKAIRGSSVRVRRQNEIVVESTVSGLRRFKEDVREVAAGYECGVTIANFNDFQVGDILEFYGTAKAS